MVRKAVLLHLALLIALPVPAPAARLRELLRVEGVRRVQLLGYGLVAGLRGKGDSDKTLFTFQSVANMLEHLGVKVDPDDLKLKNVAAVVVTAELPPFARVGTRVDALVASLGDAKSLEGGVLLLTPLRGPDGRIYALAQGPLVVGGFAAAGAAAGVGKNPALTARVVGGVVLERPLPRLFHPTDRVVLSLRSPDFATLWRVRKAIDRELGEGYCRPLDGASLEVRLPPGSSWPEVLARIEQLEVQPLSPAKVVVNERTGTVVIGEAVRISPAAVTQGSLTIEIREAPQVSQPLPFSVGETVVTPRTRVSIKEERTPLYLLPATATLGELRANTPLQASHAALPAALLRAGGHSTIASSALRPS